MKVLQQILVAGLIFIPVSLQAAGNNILMCDELLALNDKQAFCRYYSPKRDERGSIVYDDFEFAGRLYQNGKLQKLPDGDYSTRLPFTRSFKVENGHVMERRQTTFLNDTSSLVFYDTNTDGDAGQRVYKCDKKTDVGMWPCSLAEDGVYEDRSNTKIRVERGFLKHVSGDSTLSACRLIWLHGKTSVDCEDRN